MIFLRRLLTMDCDKVNLYDIDGIKEGTVTISKIKEDIIDDFLRPCWEDDAHLCNTIIINLAYNYRHPINFINCGYFESELNEWGDHVMTLEQFTALNGEYIYEGKKFIYEGNNGRIVFRSENDRHHIFMALTECENHPSTVNVETYVKLVSVMEFGIRDCHREFGYWIINPDCVCSVPCFRCRTFNSGLLCSGKVAEFAQKLWLLKQALLPELAKEIISYLPKL